jgi:hypothetical protein
MQKLKKGTKKMKYHTNEENKINRNSIKIRKKNVKRIIIQHYQI